MESPLPSDTIAPSIGTVVAGKYRVESLIATGGMGTLVLAEHLLLGQKVAIKFVLAAEERREAVARFVREAQATGTLHGEHIVRVMDVGTLDDGSPFMVMEYLRGADLRDELSRRGPLPISEAVEYVLQACEALAEAHAHGIVHRDVKPSNLFLTRRPDGTPCVKVLDFGISKLVIPKGHLQDPALTSTRAVLGSPQYMSPEQVRNARNVDARCDIWGLGVTLYELLVDAMPFEGDTVPALSATIVADPPIPVRQVRPEVPEQLDAVILRCLEKDPNQRFHGAAELALALAPFASQRAMITLERTVAIAREHRPLELHDTARSERDARHAAEAETLMAPPRPSVAPEQTSARTMPSAGNDSGGSYRGPVTPHVEIARARTGDHGWRGTRGRAVVLVLGLVAAVTGLVAFLSSAAQNKEPEELPVQQATFVEPPPPVPRQQVTPLEQAASTPTSTPLASPEPAADRPRPAPPVSRRPAPIDPVVPAAAPVEVAPAPAEPPQPAPPPSTPVSVDPLSDRK